MVIDNDYIKISITSCKINLILVRSKWCEIVLYKSRVRKFVALDRVRNTYIHESGIKNLMIQNYIGCMENFRNKIKDNSRNYTNKTYQNKYMDFLDPIELEFRIF